MTAIMQTVLFMLAVLAAVAVTADLFGRPFPHRDLILFVSFGVIIVTLVGQGMMLPSVLRWLGLTHIGAQERAQQIEAELAGRQATLEAVKKRLERFIEEREPPEAVIELLRTRNEGRLQILPKDMKDGLDHMRLSASLKRELIDAERAFIYELLRDGKITDEARRRIEYELDLEEASVANRARDGGGGGCDAHSSW